MDAHLHGASCSQGEGIIASWDLLESRELLLFPLFFDFYFLFLFFLLFYFIFYFIFFFFFLFSTTLADALLDDLKEIRIFQCGSHPLFVVYLLVDCTVRNESAKRLSEMKKKKNNRASYFRLQSSASLASQKCRATP